MKDFFCLTLKKESFNGLFPRYFKLLWNLPTIINRVILMRYAQLLSLSD